MYNHVDSETSYKAGRYSQGHGVRRIAYAGDAQGARQARRRRLSASRSADAACCRHACDARNDSRSARALCAHRSLGQGQRRLQAAQASRASRQRGGTRCAARGPRQVAQVAPRARREVLFVERTTGQVRTRRVYKGAGRQDDDDRARRSEIGHAFRDLGYSKLYGAL